MRFTVLFVPFPITAWFLVPLTFWFLNSPTWRAGLAVHQMSSTSENHQFLLKRSFVALISPLLHRRLDDIYL